MATLRNGKYSVHGSSPLNQRAVPICCRVSAEAEEEEEEGENDGEDDDEAGGDDVGGDGVGGGGGVGCEAKSGEGQGHFFKMDLSPRYWIEKCVISF